MTSAISLPFVEAHSNVRCQELRQATAGIKIVQMDCRQVTDAEVVAEIPGEDRSDQGFDVDRESRFGTPS